MAAPGPAGGPIVYKICPQADWLRAAAAGIYAGSPDDLRDGFIHLSTEQQLTGTLAKHHTGCDGLVLIAFGAATLGQALRWEVSRGGDLFPHLYALLRPALALELWPLTRDADGRHRLPDLSAHKETGGQ